MTSYKILKQELFSIKNSGQAIQTNKEKREYATNLSDKLHEITLVLPPDDVEKLIGEVEQMLNPDSN